MRTACNRFQLLEMTTDAVLRFTGTEAAGSTRARLFARGAASAAAAPLAAATAAPSAASPASWPRFAIATWIDANWFAL